MSGIIIRKITLFPVILFLVGCGNHHLLKEVKKLENYPSASAIEFINKQYWIIGDDANNLIILDSNLKIADSIQLFNFKEKRISKSVKPDFEAMTMLRSNHESRLMILGSGSLIPYRNLALLIHPRSKQIDSVRLDTIYARFLQNDLKEVNIESAATIPGSILLANRGNKGYPSNALIFLPSNFLGNQAHASINVVKLGGNDDTLAFKGVSGMCYSYKSDRLIMTISTEDTRNALDDGAIGKSYLWIFKNISGKRRWKAANPDQVIELDALDERFKGQKIESVCVYAESRDFLHLVLVADNDDGSSTLFRVVVEKK